MLHRCWQKWEKIQEEEEVDVHKDIVSENTSVGE